MPHYITEDGRDTSVQNDPELPFNPEVDAWMTDMGFSRLRIIEGYTEVGEHSYIVPIPPLDWYGHDSGEVLILNQRGGFLCYGLDVVTDALPVQPLPSQYH